MTGQKEQKEQQVQGLKGAMVKSPSQMPVDLHNGTVISA